MDSNYNIELIRIGPGWSIREGAVEICYLPAAAGWTDEMAGVIHAAIRKVGRAAYRSGYADGLETEDPDEYQRGYNDAMAECEQDKEKA